MPMLDVDEVLDSGSGLIVVTVAVRMTFITDDARPDVDSYAQRARQILASRIELLDVEEVDVLDARVGWVSPWFRPPYPEVR